MRIKKEYMKSLLYMFRRYRVATLLNLLGLGVAVATFYLFMTQVIYNRTYNHNIHDYKHMYRLEIYGGLFGEAWGCNICRPFVTLLKEIPQVKDATYISPYINKTDVKVGNRTITVPLINMGKPGIEFFTGKLLSGSSKTCADGANVIVNRSTAEKMFGTANAVGKTFEGENNNETKTTVTVVGVSEDMPDNCTLPNGVYVCENESVMNEQSEWSFNVYLLLDDGANPKKVERAIKLAFMKDNGYSEKDEKKFDKEVNMKIRITPVDDIYFSGVGPKDRGNRGLVDVLTVASVFVLFIAMLNLLNFSLSEVPMRMRGINTRRVMGASIGSLRMKMILENVVFAFVGLVIGILLIVAFQRSETCMKLVSGDIHFASHMVSGCGNGCFGSRRGCIVGNDSCLLQHIVRAGNGAERIVRTLATWQTAAYGYYGCAVLRGFRIGYIYRCDVEPVELHLQQRLWFQQERGVLCMAFAGGEG